VLQRRIDRRVRRFGRLAEGTSGGGDQRTLFILLFLFVVFLYVESSSVINQYTLYLPSLATPGLCLLGHYERRPRLELPIGLTVGSDEDDWETVRSDKDDWGTVRSEAGDSDTERPGPGENMDAEDGDDDEDQGGYGDEEEDDGGASGDDDQHCQAGYGDDNEDNEGRYGEDEEHGEDDGDESDAERDEHEDFGDETHTGTGTDGSTGRHAANLTGYQRAIICHPISSKVQLPRTESILHDADNHGPSVRSFHQSLLCTSGVPRVRRHGW